MSLRLRTIGALATLLLALASCATPPVTQPVRPTPAPTRMPFATRSPFVGGGTERAATVMHLPETILQVDLATHPTEGWPAVVAVAAPLVMRDAPRVMVRVFDRRTHRWGDAQSLGVGGSGLARTRFRTAQIGVSAAGEIVVVWGATNEPNLGLRASSSRDGGLTWSPPAAIAADTYGVLDLAVTPDGEVAAVAISEAHQRPLLIRRSAAGAWQTPEVLPVSAWYGSGGAVLVSGVGSVARTIVAVSGGGEGSADSTLFLLSRAGGGTWRVERRVVPSPDEQPAGLLAHLRAIETRTSGSLVAFAMAGRSVGYAVASLDGGLTWGEVALIFTGEGDFPPWIALAFDAHSDRAIALWTCCGDASFIGAESTHYASWGAPDGRGWLRQPTRAPLVSGAIAAADTVSAQARNSRFVWLAWVEQVHQVQVRALDLAQVVER